MLNAGGRVVTPVQGAKRLGRSPSFKRGYDDYVKNRPYDYEIPSKPDAIDYARGRNFAIWCIQNKAPRSTWRNGVAANTVIDRIVTAIRSAYVI